MAEITCIRDSQVTTDNVEFDKVNIKMSVGNVISTALLRHINDNKKVAILDVDYQ